MANKKKKKKKKKKQFLHVMSAPRLEAKEWGSNSWS